MTRSLKLQNFTEKRFSRAYDRKARGKRVAGVLKIVDMGSEWQNNYQVSEASPNSTLKRYAHAFDRK